MENFEERLKNIRNFVEKDKQRREELVRKHWEILPKFNKPEDVPTLPRVDEKEWKEFYIPKLIGAGAIPKKDLVDGQIYIGEHRRCTEARWDSNNGVFVYLRNKWGMEFTDTCNHFEDDDGFALFVPIRLKKD